MNNISQIKKMLKRFSTIADNQKAVYLSSESMKIIFLSDKVIFLSLKKNHLKLSIYLVTSINKVEKVEEQKISFNENEKFVANFHFQKTHHERVVN